MNAIPMVSITAEECVDSFIRHWVSWFGAPEHVYTDRGSQFSSALWSQMCPFLGTQAHRSTAYHPQAQGQIERLNRTLKTSLKCWEDPTAWHDHLPWVLMALRNSPKDDLAGFSPNDMTLGHPIRLPGKFFDDTNGFEGTDMNLFVSRFRRYVSSLRFMPPRRVNR